MKVVLGTDGSPHAKYAEEFLQRYPISKQSPITCASAFSSVHLLMATSHPFLGPILADQISEGLRHEKRKPKRPQEKARLGSEPKVTP